MLVPVSTRVPPEPIPNHYDIQNIACVDRKATRVPRLPFKRYIPSRPPASLLAVKPQSSILAPHVLNAMKMALITGKHGVPTAHNDIIMDTRKRKPEDDEITCNNKKNKLIQTRDVMKAEAAYRIARNLVSWMDGIIIDDSEEMVSNNDEKLEEDIEIKHEDIKQEYGEIKHEDISPSYTSCDEKLEEECVDIKTEDIKTEDAKHEGEEKKRDDWYHMNGQSLSFDVNFSYLEDALRAHDLSPTSDIVTPPSLASELSMESEASAQIQRSASASQSCGVFSAPASFPSGSPAPQPLLQYDAMPLIPLSSPPCSPMPMSLPLLPTLSEMHTYLPLSGISMMNEKLETQQALFPTIVEGWQAAVNT